jgi:hypothetical protein
MDFFYPNKNKNLAMETELEQEGNDNTWRTADIRIRKTQVLFNRSLLFLNVVLSVIVCLFVFPYYRN